MDDLKAILPEERRVEAGGEVFALRPFGFRFMAKALPHFAALLEYVKAKEVDGVLRLQFNLDQLLEEGGDHLVVLVALATGKDTAWAGELPFDDGCALAAAILELNSDFFARTRARKAAAMLPGSDGATS